MLLYYIYIYYIVNIIILQYIYNSIYVIIINTQYNNNSRMSRTTVFTVRIFDKIEQLHGEMCNVG